MATVEQVIALLGVIAAAYPERFEITDGRIDVYADLLADLDIDALKAATRQHLATSPHPPAPSDLRALARRLTTPIEQAPPDWGEAWRELLDQIGRVGSYGTPTWSSPLVAEVVRRFGPWRELCAMEIANTGTDRAQFRDMYNAVASRARDRAALLPDVRAFAQSTGALPVPVEDAPPALPEPQVGRGGGVSEKRSLANFRRYQAEMGKRREQREAAGRAAYDQWLASQSSVVERRNAPQEGQNVV